MSRVGYGDMYPKTILGKFIGSAVIFGSTVFMAVPMTIIVTKFGECYGKMKNAKQVGPERRRQRMRKMRFWESQISLDSNEEEEEGEGERRGSVEEGIRNCCCGWCCRNC